MWHSGTRTVSPDTWCVHVVAIGRDAALHCTAGGGRQEQEGPSGQEGRVLQAFRDRCRNAGCGFAHQRAPASHGNTSRHTPQGRGQERHFRGRVAGLWSGTPADTNHDTVQFMSGHKSSAAGAEAVLQGQGRQTHGMVARTWHDGMWHGGTVAQQPWPCRGYCY